MANTQIDVAMNADISDITHTAAGTVTNGVRVVIAAIESDRITLETS